MKIKSVIRKVLREEYTPTETEYLGWDVPKGLYDELESIGVKRYNTLSDKIYVSEIQFDTQSVVFEILNSEGYTYYDLNNVPVSYETYHTLKIEDLPKNVKIFLVRRLEKSWFNYMGI